MTRWSLAGAVFACVIAGSFDASRLITVAFVGFCSTGAAAGAAAVFLHRDCCRLALLGFVAAICGATLAYLFLGASHGFWEHIGRGILGSVAAFLILRFGLPGGDQVSLGSTTKI